MSTMNVAPELGDFLAAVRTHLADLDPDEQREILDGLEADLGELVAEQGVGALGDPAAYAGELRAAAGLSPAAKKSRRPVRASFGSHAQAVLDAVRVRWDGLVSSVPGDLAGLLEALRPAWWVARAWIAVQVGALAFDARELHVVPDSSTLGVVALLVAVVASVQLGRGKVLPPEKLRWFASLRLLVIGLNVLAIAMVPAVLNGLSHGIDASWNRAHADGYGDAQEAAGSEDKAGIYVDGEWVSNIYPYDAQGHPLVGVQLFNQIGEPINVITQPEYKVLEYDEDGNPVDEDGKPLDPDTVQLPRVFYPWSNGATQLFNVFPLPSRAQEGEDRSPTAFTEKVRPKVGPFPKPLVPGISLPGIVTGAR